MHPVRIAALLSLIAASPLHARFQDEEPDVQDYWIDVFYPKLFWTSRDGFAAGGYVALIQPVRFMDFATEPASYRASAALNVLATTEGTRHAHLTVAAPAYAEGWRFTGQLGAWREARDPYFGIGNETTFDDDNVTDAAPFFYDAIRTWYRARGEVQRHIAGPLRVLWGVNLERWKLQAPAGPSVLADDADAAGGSDPMLARFVSDISGRIGLVVDTRDDEVAPKNGVLVEAIVGGASESVAGDLSYSRTTVSARGYITPVPRLTLAGRVLAQGMGGRPDIGTYYLIEESDHPSTGIGGGYSHRGLQKNRLLGRHKLLGNAEVRYEIVGLPTLYSLTGVAFLDAGRVFEGEGFRFTLSGLHVGGGGGLVFQLGRRGVLGLLVGVGPDGVASSTVTRWSF